MRLKTCLAIGLAGLFAAHGPATAGDLDSSAAGGIRNYNSGGVPVPMPITYEETYKWYLRGDIGTAFKNSGTLANEGMPLNLISPNEWQNQSIVSFGFGKYLTPSFRAEFTVDYHSDRQVANRNPITADAVITKSQTTAGPPVVTEVDVGLYHGVQDENIKYSNSTFMLSGYYDLINRGSFRPFVGLGIGIARHQISRVGADIYTCDPTSSISTVTINAVVTPNTCGGLLTTPIIETTKAENTGYGLAAHATAGISYDLSPRIHWDTAYRLMWQSGHMAVFSSAGVNGVRLGDQFNHEVRTGVRWDIW